MFAGGFDLAAAEFVAGYVPLDPYRVIDLLDELTVKSLLVADIQESKTRYRLLESFARVRR